MSQMVQKSLIPRKSRADTCRQISLVQAQMFDPIPEVDVQFELQYQSWKNSPLAWDPEI